MTGTMARPKKKPGGEKPSPAPTPETPKGGKIDPISYRPTQEVNDALASFRARHRFPPTKTRVIELALRMYLRSEGFNELPLEPPNQD